ncbi:MAG: hypothetical protein GY946_23310, partial [bacterium]|nr:hypothetical protein [bacterium]
LRRIDPGIPAAKSSVSGVDLALGERREGYGAATPEAESAVRAAAKCGLDLETTYTGKCLAEIVARAGRNELPGPTLFWNTYNALDVAAQAPRRAEIDELPASIRRLLQ